MKDIHKLMPSNKKFGFFFSLVFISFFFYYFYKNQIFLFQIFFIIAVITLFTTLFFSKLLFPFNKLWFKIGLLLGKIISPIVLGLVFFLLISPISIILRLIGRDELKLKKLHNKTYWIIRSNVLIKPESFKDQF